MMAPFFERNQDSSLGGTVLLFLVVSTQQPFLLIEWMAKRFSKEVSGCFHGLGKRFMRSLSTSSSVFQPETKNAWSLFLMKADTHKKVRNLIRGPFSVGENVYHEAN